MHERIRMLRKELGLNQSEFGERIGVSRSVIANIELNRVEPKRLLINHICDIFNVNGQWLEHGTGEVFETGSRYGRTLDELWRLYQGLRPEFQEYVLKQIHQLLEMQKSNNNH